jgi:hypothetical protein
LIVALTSIPKRTGGASSLRAAKNQPVEKPVGSSGVIAPVGGMELEGWTLPADKRPFQYFVVSLSMGCSTNK